MPSEPAAEKPVPADIVAVPLIWYSLSNDEKPTVRESGPKLAPNAVKVEVVADAVSEIPGADCEGLIVTALEVVVPLTVTGPTGAEMPGSTEKPMFPCRLTYEPVVVVVEGLISASWFGVKVAP